MYNNTYGSPSILVDYGPWLVLITAIGLFFLVWRFLHSIARSMIRSHFEEKRYVLLECVWEPFGPGWFGGDRSICYHVTYRNEKGALYQAYCRAGLFSGIYFAEVTLLEPEAEAVSEVGPSVDLTANLPSTDGGEASVQSMPDPSYEDLLSEVHRLREENATLRETVKKLGG